MASQSVRRHGGDLRQYNDRGDARNHLEFDADRPETTIVIQASNFFIAGAACGPIWNWEPHRQSAARMTGAFCLMQGALAPWVIMGNYHLCLFSQRRRDHTNLYFGWLCIAFSIRALLVGQILVTRVFPEFPGRWRSPLNTSPHGLFCHWAWRMWKAAPKTCGCARLGSSRQYAWPSRASLSLWAQRSPHEQ